MAVEVDGRSVETDDKGYLVNIEEWNESVAAALAAKEGLDLTDRHWEVIHYLRDEYFTNGEHQPNTRTIVKDMQARWTDEKVTAQSLYQLFPLDPSKQAGRIAGLPESRRKGGY